MEEDDPRRLPDLIRLNEQWIRTYFELEEPDLALARDPGRILRHGGHTFSLVQAGRVLGVCALFRTGERTFELARMAVEPDCRGRGWGRVLAETALAKAWARGTESVSLMSNTRLVPAVSLYRSLGFVTTVEGRHPHYRRSNIQMELRRPAGA